jgi:hypothetical protein
VAIAGLAMATGHWKNSISAEEYRGHFRQIESASYTH